MAARLAIVVLAMGGIFVSLLSRANSQGGTEWATPAIEPTIGSDNAPVVGIYYTDYTCIACREFARNILPELRRRFVLSGRLQLLLRELPRDSLGMMAAIAARCAGEFGKHWAFHDSIFSIGKGHAAALAQTAARIGVPSDPFARCVGSGRYAGGLSGGGDIAPGPRTIGVPSIALWRRGARADRV
jgi:hypothetical protein